jgi:ubiquitin C-terminal hydrolase
MATSLKRSRVECDLDTKVFLKSRNDYSVLSKRHIPKLPLGLANLGNTCFMSAVIQVLFHLKDFRNFILVEENLNVLNKVDTHLYSIEQDLEIAKSLRNLFLELQKVRENENVQTYVSPTSFHTCLKKYAYELFNFQQQDAHEFLRFLLASIQNLFANKTANTVKMKQENSCSNNGQPFKDVIESLFGGTVVTKTRCLECENETSHNETFLDISLPVFGRRSISWAISNCCKREVLMGNNKYACENCLTYTEAERYWSFLELPPILIFHLKLFSHNTRKLNQVPPCPVELKMTRWCDSKVDNSLKTYRLSAIIVHQGFGLGEGHYYTFVSSQLTDYISCSKHPDDENISIRHTVPWYCLNDTKTFVISESDLMKRLFESSASIETPYILFYVKEA